MTRYKNFSGSSGVLSYQLSIDSITIKFADRTNYLHSFELAGRADVEEMKRLAIAGKDWRPLSKKTPALHADMALSDP
jgi:hypothetical protein